MCTGVKLYAYLACLFSILLVGEVQAQKPDYDYIKPFTISREITSDTPPHILKIIITHCMNMRNWELTSADIDSVKYVGAYKLKGMESDSAMVFRFGLSSHNLPMTAWPFTRTLIVNNKNHICYLVEVETVEPVKIKDDDDVHYFAGRYKIRAGYGVFNIYEFKKGILTQIFQSPDYVSNSSLDCMSYETADLKLENVDTNGDSCLDLKFTGVKNFYCNGLETYGRLDRKPLRRELVTIIYQYDKEKLWK